jgi:hypothetical protein
MKLLWDYVREFWVWGALGLMMLTGWDWIGYYLLAVGVGCMAYIVWSVLKAGIEKLSEEGRQ